MESESKCVILDTQVVEKEIHATTQKTIIGFNDPKFSKELLYVCIEKEETTCDVASDKGSNPRKRKLDDIEDKEDKEDERINNSPLDSHSKEESNSFPLVYYVDPLLLLRESPIFKSMFCGPFLENQEQKFMVFSDIYNHAYTDESLDKKSNPKNLELYRQLLIVSDRFQVTSLLQVVMKLVVPIIKEMSKIDEVQSVIDSFDKYINLASFKPIKKQCKKLLAGIFNATNLNLHKLCAVLSAQAMLLLVDNVDISLESENIMFGIIMQWKLRKGIGFTHPDVLPLLLTLRYDNMTPSYLYHAAELIMESPFSEIKTKMTDKTMFDYMLICNRVREAMHVKFVVLTGQYHVCDTYIPSVITHIPSYDGTLLRKWLSPRLKMPLSMKKSVELKFDTSEIVNDKESVESDDVLCNGYTLSLSTRAKYGDKTILNVELDINMFGLYGQSEVTSTIIVDWKVRTNRGEIRFREKSDCYHEDGGLTFCLPRNLHETIPASVMSQYPKDCSKILPLTTPVTEGQHISVSASVFLMDGQTT